MPWTGWWWLLLLGGEGPVDPAQAGLECFEQLDFVCAAELLTLAVGEEKEPQQLKRLLRSLAESQVALRQQEQAIETFVRLLELEPDFSLEERDASPLVREALAQARRRLTPPAAEPAAAAVAPPVLSGLPPVAAGNASASRLELSAGVPFLFERDRDTLWPGGCFTFTLARQLGPQVQAALAVRYAFFPLRARGSALQLGALLGELGAWLEPGRWRAGGTVALGLGGFGLAGEEGRAVLLLTGQVFAQWRLGRWWWGPAVSPEWLMTLDRGPFHSLTLVLGMRVTREL